MHGTSVHIGSRRDRAVVSVRVTGVIAGGCGRRVAMLVTGVVVTGVVVTSVVVTGLLFTFTGSRGCERR